MIKNKFIVLEGIEGAGKTHACDFIKRLLHKYNIKNTLLVRQPGSTEIAEEIRRIIKKKYQSEKLVKETELLLMYAARIQLFEKIIKPALKNGIWVISDRHDLSSLAYQGGGLGIDIKKIKNLKEMFLKSYTPDLTFYLDVSPQIGLQRALKREKLDIIEQRPLTFFKNTRKEYLRNIKLEENVIQINANLDISTVHKKIQKKLLHWLKKISL